MTEKYKVAIVSTSTSIHEDSFKYYDYVEYNLHLNGKVDPIEVTKEELDILCNYHRQHPKEFRNTAVVIIEDNQTSPSLSETLQEAKNWAEEKRKEDEKKEAKRKKASEARKRKAKKDKLEQFEKLKKELGK